MISVFTARGMPALIAFTLAGFAGYGTLLPTAPLWAVEGGATAAGAGLVNGVLLLSTVLTQLFVPALLRRFGWARVMGAGMVFMGVPALGHLLSDELGPILALAAVRGVGFGVLTVTGSAAVAELVDPARRGAAIGAYGLAVALPNLVLLPLGPWIAQTWGFGAVFALAALPLTGLPAVVALARHLPEPARRGRPMLDATGAAPSGEPDEMSPGRASVLLLRPTLLLLGVTLCGGALTTFAPQMVDSTAASTLALFAIGATAALTRWGAGGLADRFGTYPFLWPLTLLTVVGMLLCAWVVSHDGSTLWADAGFVAAAALVGFSYGALQNLTLVLAFAVVTRRHLQLASAVWNVGFDAGTGLGSVLVGLIAAGYGFATALGVAAVASACTIPLALVRGSSLTPLSGRGC